MFFGYIFIILLFFGLCLFMAYNLYATWSAAPFVPTFKKNAERMLRLARVAAGETLMDLGSGDGRIVRLAARHGATAIGIELNPFLCWWSQCLNWLGGYKNVTIRRANLWGVDLSHVDVLTLFFIHGKMGELKQKIEREMKPGSRVVSRAFQFPDWQWTAKDGTVYLYVVHPPR